VVKVVASIVTDTVAGNAFTVAGETVQKLPPENEQDNVTVPVNPSCAARLTGPLVLLPALTFGNGADSVNVKSGFVVTVNDSGCVFGAGAPVVLAIIKTLVVPTGVLYGTVTITLALTGDPAVGLAVGGVNAQLAPAGKPVQLKDTVPLNAPAPVT